MFTPPDWLPISPETLARLTAYGALLQEWNARMNLVAKSTIPAMWERHFLDSAQLFPLIPPQAKILTDLGSGAGFPGLVLAALAQGEGRMLKVRLIESTAKKTAFLQEAAAIMGLGNVTIHTARAEAIPPWKSDVVTARAFAPLSRLLGYAAPFLQKEHLCLLLKGCRATDEMEEARRHWNFTVELSPSRLPGDGVILALQNIRKKS